MTRASGWQAEPTGREEPHGDPERWAPRLERVLDEQAELCARLEELGRRQGELIEAGSTDELLGVLAERQAVVGRVTELSKEIEPFGRNWDSLSAKLAGDRRAVIKEKTDRIEGLIATIAARDEADRAKLEKQRAAVGSELGKMATSRGAVAAYGRGSGPGPSGARYQDREG